MIQRRVKWKEGAAVENGSCRWSRASGAAGRLRLAACVRSRWGLWDSAGPVKAPQGPGYTTVQSSGSGGSAQPPVRILRNWVCGYKKVT